MVMTDVADVLRTVADAIEVDDLAGHNAGISRYDGNLWHHLVVVEGPRFARALEMLEPQSPGTVVDLGCLLPYMPIVLARRGWNVTAVDRYDLYGPTLRSAVERCAKAEGFELVDADILEKPDLGAFDVALLMAVVEHLNGSPLPLLEHIREMLNPGGRLLFEVPNLAELGKRIGLLRGRSPLPLIEEYARSDYPFTGHNREMTVAEVKWLLDAAEFDIEQFDCFDYSPPNRGLKPAVIRHLRRRLPDAAETIMALAKRRPATD
jgi:SAM-dependent methyltransferase